MTPIATLDDRPTTAAVALPKERAPGAPRLDFYASIHKAIRLWMSETLVRIGRIDVTDAVDRDDGLARLNALLDMCESHIRHENDFVHTAIEARQPAGSRRIAEEHQEHTESIAALREEAARLAGTGSADAQHLALRLYRHLALFVAENFQHMHIEETVHNGLLWQHYTDEELDALHGRLLASLTPQMHLTVARWMLPASTPTERAGMVAGMAAQMPPEALLGVLREVRPHLDDIGWLKLAAAAKINPDVFGR